MGTLNVDKLAKTSTGAAEFTLPAADGTAGQVMQTDGSGQLSIAALAADTVGNTQLADDAVGVAELSATGTASGTTALFGDNAWKAVSDVSGLASVQTFTTLGSQPWTRPTGITKVIIEVQGGGGSGAYTSGGSTNCGGGAGGTGGPTSSYGSAPGGAGTNGDLNITGQTGMTSTYSSGGSSQFGNGGWNTWTGQYTGGDGTGYGSGGGGGYQSPTGAGAQGIVIVTEYK